MASFPDAQATNEKAVDDSAAAAEAVQHAVALVRSATGKLNNPLPAGRGNLAGSFLASLTTPVRQQKTLLEFNPLDAHSFAELATQVVKQVTQPQKSRTTEQDGFIKAVVAATAKATQKSSASAIAGRSAGQTATAIASKAAPQKFSLVKPSLQDVNAQLIDMWDRISQTSPSPELKKIADTNSTNLRQINNTIAPRAVAGRSPGATLGKLLQQIEALADDGNASLVHGPGISGMLEEALRPPRKSRPAPKPPAALVKLAEIVGDVWDETFASSDPQKKSTTTPTQNKTVAAPASKANTSTETQSTTSLLSDLMRTFTPTTPTVSAGSNAVAGNPTAAVDVYAIADGLNDVLREQAWLAGVDLT